MSHLATPAAVWIHPHIEPALADLIQVIQDAASPMGSGEEKLSEVLLEQSGNIAQLGHTLEVAGLRSCAVVLDLACQAINVQVRPDMELDDPVLGQVVEVVLWAAFHTSNLVECLALGNMDDPSYSRKILAALAPLAGREKIQDWELFAPQVVSLDQDHYLDHHLGPTSGFQLGQEVYWVISRLTVGLASMPGLSSFIPGVAPELPRLTQEVQHFSQLNTPASFDAQSRCVSILRRTLYGLACALRGIDDRQPEASLLPSLNNWPSPLRDVVQAYGLARALPRQRERQYAQRVVSGLNISVVQATVKATRDALASTVENIESGDDVDVIHASTIVSSLDFLGLPALAKRLAHTLSSFPDKQLGEELSDIALGLEDLALSAQSANPPVFKSGSEQVLADGVVEKLAMVKSEIQSGVESLSEDEDIPSQLIVAQNGTLQSIVQDFSGLGLDLPSQYMSQLRAWLSELGAGQVVSSNQLRAWAQAYAFVEYAFDALLAGHRGAADILFSARHLLVQAGFDPQPGQEMEAPEYLLPPKQDAVPSYDEVAVLPQAEVAQEVAQSQEETIEPEFEMVSAAASESASATQIDPEVAKLAARPDLPAHIRALLEKSLPTQEQESNEEVQAQPQDLPAIEPAEEQYDLPHPAPSFESQENISPDLSVEQAQTPQQQHMPVEDQAVYEFPGTESFELDASVPVPESIFSKEEISTLDLYSEKSHQDPEDSPAQSELTPVSESQDHPPAPSWDFDFDWSESSSVPTQDISAQELPEADSSITEVSSLVFEENLVLEDRVSSQDQEVEANFNIEPFDVPELHLDLLDFQQQPEPEQEPAFEELSAVHYEQEYEVVQRPETSHNSELSSLSEGISPRRIVPFDAPATVSIDGDMEEVFAEEIGEELISLSEWTPALFVVPPNPDILYNIRKSFHTIKGSGRMVGAASLGEMAWAIESVLNRVLDNRRPLSDNVIALVLHAQKMVEQFSLSMQGKPACWDIETLIAWALRLEKGEEVESPFPSSIDWAAIASELSAKENQVDVEGRVGIPEQFTALTQDDEASLTDTADQPTAENETEDSVGPQFEVLPLLETPNIELEEQEQQEAPFQGDGILSLPDFDQPSVEISIEHVSDEVAEAPWLAAPTPPTQDLGVLDMDVLGLPLDNSRQEQKGLSEPPASTSEFSLASDWTLSDDIPQPQQAPQLAPEFSEDLAARISSLSLQPLDGEEPLVSPEPSLEVVPSPSAPPVSNAEQSSVEQGEDYSTKLPPEEQVDPQQVAAPVDPQSSETAVPSSLPPVPVAEPMRPRPLTQDVLLQGTDWKVLLSHVQDQSISLRTALSSNDLLAARDCVDRQIQALDRLGELMLVLERSGNTAAARLRSLSARQSSPQAQISAPKPAVPEPAVENSSSPSPQKAKPVEAIAVTPPSEKQPFWKRWFSRRK